MSNTLHCKPAENAIYRGFGRAKVKIWTIFCKQQDMFEVLGRAKELTQTFLPNLE